MTDTIRNDPIDTEAYLVLQVEFQSRGRSFEEIERYWNLLRYLAAHGNGEARSTLEGFREKVRKAKAKIEQGVT